MQQELPLAAPRPPKNQALLCEALWAMVHELANGRPVKRKHLFSATHRLAEALAKNRDPQAPTPRWSDSQCRTAYKELRKCGQPVAATRAGYLEIDSWQDYADAAAMELALLHDREHMLHLLYANTLRKLGPPPVDFHLQQELNFHTTIKPETEDHDHAED